MACPIIPTNPTATTYCEKGCIHWFQYDSDPSISSQKARPYIIIGRNNPKSSRIIVSPVVDSTNYLENGKLKYPYHVPLYKSHYSFLEKDSVILLDQVYTIKKDELWKEWYMGQINDFSDLDKAICYNFDLFKSITNAYVDLLGQFEQLYKLNFTRK